MTSEAIELLQLDVEHVQQSARTGEMFAAVPNVPAGQRMSFALMSACSRSLLAERGSDSVGEARLAWARTADLAAEFATDVGALAGVIDLCAGGSGARWLRSVDLSATPLDPTTAAYIRLVGASNGISGEPHGPQAPLSWHDATPVGRTHAPGLMWRAAVGDLVSPANDPAVYRQWLVVSLGAMLVPIQIAMSDRAHWRRMLCPLLPIEPECLAVAMVGAQLLGTTPLGIIRGSDSPPDIVRALLDVADVLMSGRSFGSSLRQ